VTEVVHGFCPDCGECTRADHRAPALGAQCFSYPPRERVVACRCGSRARPIESEEAKLPYVPGPFDDLRR
jgi:hypothetical protein